MTWEMLTSGYKLIEGPTIDLDRSLVFSDVLGGGVHRLGSDGSVTTIVPKRRGVGGIARHGDGGVVVGGRTLQHIDSGELVAEFMIDDVPGYNDFGTDAVGRIYAGSVRFNTFDPNASHQPGELWRIDLDGSASMLYGDVQQCNGVGISPDGTTIYHSDTRSKCLIVHDLADCGIAAANRRRWPLGDLGHPDGLAIDVTGAVWVADFGATRIVRFRPDGTIDSTLSTPMRFVTSLCFDGTDIIAVSAADPRAPELEGSIWRINVGVEGAPIHPVRVAT